MIRVVAGVIREGDRVLICQRSERGPHPGKWEFPGGKLEPGEGPEQALRRELREELGVEAEVGELLWTTEHRYPGVSPVELRFFLVRRLSEPPRNLVFAAIRWARPGFLGTIDFLEGNRDFVLALDSGELALF